MIPKVGDIFVYKHGKDIKCKVIFVNKLGVVVVQTLNAPSFSSYYFISEDWEPDVSTIFNHDLAALLEE